MREKIEEMMLDARSVEVGNKKEMNLKYGLNFGKIGEIQKAILEKAMVLRKGYECTDYGRKLFDCYWNYPESPAKLKKALADEPTEFLQYYLDHLKKLYSLNHRREAIRRSAEFVYKLLKERARDEKGVFGKIVERLMVEAEEFHKAYVTGIVEYEMKRFRYFEQYKGFKAHTYEKWEKNEYGCYKVVPYIEIDKNNKVEPPKDLTINWLKFFNMVMIESNGFKADVYEAKVRADAENTFRNNINTIAEKCEHMEMNPDLIRIDYVGRDMKVFEMILTDGTKKVHCRSIFCAEFSVLVTPHWRFIMTNIK